ncbi:hypothetical protein [Haloprofundus halobius]|uniref:hypothetical protein n=1 Tax=Haloprofundus halobius TaxID=2876194 RepID=UPI001CCE1CAB|nr:hypothetical protein [Haloprofundus halobius]
MSILDSLPSRPLSDAELAALNRADAVELAIAVDDGPTEALLLATESWVKALAFDADGDGWRTVETTSLDEMERYEALKRCEEAIGSCRF